MKDMVKHANSCRTEAAAVEPPRIEHCFWIDAWNRSGR
jgi:hypothetical protein